MSEQVTFTVAEFAYLVGRCERWIRVALRDGKIKGIQEAGKCGTWLIPESELVKYWGNLYGRPDYGEAGQENDGT